MRSILFIIILTVALSCCNIVEADSIWVPYPNEQASEAINNFSGCSNLNPIISGYQKTPNADYLVASTKDTEYWLNMENFKVEGYISYSEYNNIAKIILSKEAALKIANNFAINHFDNFANKSFKLIISESYDSGQETVYHFTWQEYINKIEGPSVVDIVVNPTNGEILSYVGINREIVIPIEHPIISEENAINIAMLKFKDITIGNIETKQKIWYDENAKQRLFWIVNLRGSNELNIFMGGDVFIDAKTGEIISVYEY